MHKLLLIFAFSALSAIAFPAAAGQANDEFWYEEAFYLADNRDQRYEELTPAQKQRIEERREKFNKLPPEEQERIKKAREKFKKLSPEEKKKLKDKWKKKQKKS